MTILNKQYLVQGAGTAGLVTRRAGAGGLSSNDRIVEDDSPVLRKNGIL